jgi:hypothetical protein
MLLRIRAITWSGIHPSMLLRIRASTWSGIHPSMLLRRAYWDVFLTKCWL